MITKAYKPLILIFSTLYLLGLYFFLVDKVHKEKMGVRHEATLEQGIDFTKPGYPLFLKNVTGLSSPENWGRWSDAKDAGARIIFEFKEPLPKKFTLELVLKAYGPNQTGPIKVIVGNTVTEFYLNSKLPGNEMQKIKLAITQNDGAPMAKTIEFVAPKPTAPPKPANFNPSNPGDVDQRLLGVGLVKISIY